MSGTVRDVMTARPVCVRSTATLSEAAAQMRDNNIGDVLVLDGPMLAGVVTDRDIVVRGLAAGFDANVTTVGEVATKATIMVGADDAIEDAVRLMREHALRRLPVCEGDHVVGVVSLGDLAKERDPESLLAEISTAPPSR